MGASATVAHAEPTKTDKKESKTVVIKRGDSLSKIAKTYDTTYHRLFDANTYVENPDLIFPGNKLRIPHPDEELKKRPLPTTAVPRTVETTTKKPVAKPAPKRVESATTTTTSQQTTQTQRRAAPAPKPTGAISGSVWDRLAQCESSGNWSINTGNGYYGGLQFSLSSWRAVGGSGYPHQASKSEQIARAEKLQAIQGWGAWPACTAKLGIR